LTIEFHPSQFSSMGRLSPLQRKAETDLLAGEEAHAVQGLARGLSVLRAFRPGEGALSNAEIAARTGLSRPTVSRLTQTLTALGYLAYVPRLGRYTLGAAIASLCHSLLSGMPYRIAAQPFLREVAETTRLPVSLGARDNLHMINIDTVRHDNAPPARFDLGARIPLATTAMGRAYLFALPDAERSGLLDRIRRDAGRDWRAIREGIDGAFAMLKRRGFCISAGEWRADVVGVGAPVVTADGVVLAVNCGGPPFEISEERAMTDVGPRIAHAAASIAGNSAATAHR
jgi:DNA-binding IclR family transcriptional regulator